jgi:hypothetical protein
MIIEGEIMKNFFSIAAVTLLSGCATGGTAFENPWHSPSRLSDPTLGVEDSELVALMQPCIDYARETFPEAARRIEEELPPEASLSVTARRTNPDGRAHQFIVYVDSIDGGQIHGRIAANGVYANDRVYAWGDKYSLARADIMDWGIGYHDRPEEGNLLGKYLLLRQDGIVSGPCDPRHDEFQHFRLFRETVSFVPPVGADWHMRGRHAGFEMTALNRGPSLGEIRAVYAARLPECLSCDSDQDFLTSTKAVFGKGDAAGPKGYVQVEQEITPYTEIEAECVLLRVISENNKALLSPSRERGLVIREELEIGCMHPYREKELITLGYIHHYQPGHRDPDFVDQANRIFRSLAFTKTGNPIPIAKTQGKESVQ